ncbi:Zinc finger protein ZOP1-like protein [Drosera capensis]
MTEYWVSQGNKWCDFCKIFLSSNPATIRNHELGQRHKDNVAKRLADMRKDKAAKDKQEKEAAQALQQIEAKAKRSYQNDVASFKEARESHTAALDDEEGGPAWEYDSGSGYYCDPLTGIYYDPTSGFYYSDVLGKWVTQEEAFNPVRAAVGSKQKVPLKKQARPESGPVSEKKTAVKGQSELAPGPVVSGSLNPMRSVQGASSSVAVGKRKRTDEKPKALSAEEAAALKAREAARKRVGEREKNLLGLYGN